MQSLPFSFTTASGNTCHFTASHPTNFSTSISAKVCQTTGLSVTDQLVTINCQPLPAEVSKLTSGPAYNLITILLDGLPVLAASTCLNLATYPAQQRYQFQLDHCRTTPLTNANWLEFVSQHEQAAQACISEYQKFLVGQYHTKFVQCVRSLPAAQANLVLEVASAFLLPTPLDIGVRAKSKLANIAATFFGASFASKLKDAMQYPDCLPYMLYWLGTSNNDNA